MEALVAAGSRLEYDATGGTGEIELRLDGEALFSVEPGATRSLLVRAANAEIRDIGTRFNVRARGNRVVVAVGEGAVELSSGGRAVVVGAGQRSSAERGQPPLAVSDADVEGHMAWAAGHFVVVDEPLDEVFAEIARRYAVTFQIHPSFRGERLTASLRSGGLAETVQTVCAAVAAHCEPEAATWRVVPLTAPVANPPR